jgi:hypothetical protein
MKALARQQKIKSYLPNVIVEARFRLLLGILLSLFVVLPIFEFRLLLDAILTTLVVVTLVLVIDTAKLLKVALVFALFSIVSNWAALWVNSTTVKLLGSSAELIFLILLASVILNEVFRAQHINIETISGAICVYLLMGLMWSHVYTITELIEPNSFNNLGFNAHEPLDSDWISKLSLQLNYYSFVTLSTLGYGDITPVTRVAKSFATLEAILGQLYLAVLIARLVGQQVKRKISDN